MSEIVHRYKMYTYVKAKNFANCNIIHAHNNMELPSLIPDKILGQNSSWKNK